MEENEKALATLARTYEDLRQAKRTLKDMKKQVLDEMKASPAFEIIKEERKKLKEQTIELRLTCMEALSMDVGAMKDAETEVKELQAVMDDLMANALSQGVVKNFTEMDLAGDKITPSFKVKIKVEQMALGI